MGSGRPNQYLDVLLHTIAISGLSRVRTEPDLLLVFSSPTPHPVQTNCQSPGHSDFRGFTSAPHHQVEILVAPVGIASHSSLCRFHQKKAQHRTPLFRDVPQSPPATAGFFQRYKSQIARHLLSAPEAFWVSNDQHVSQS